MISKTDLNRWTQQIEWQIGWLNNFSSLPTTAPFPSNSLSHNVWSYRYIYIYVCPKHNNVPMICLCVAMFPSCLFPSCLFGGMPPFLHVHALSIHAPSLATLSNLSSSEHLLSRLRVLQYTHFYIGSVENTYCVCLGKLRSKFGFWGI